MRFDLLKSMLNHLWLFAAMVLLCSCLDEILFNETVDPGVYKITTNCPDAVSDGGTLNIIDPVLGGDNLELKLGDNYADFGFPSDTVKVEEAIPKKIVCSNGTRICKAYSVTDKGTGSFLFKCVDGDTVCSIFIQK